MQAIILAAFCAAQTDVTAIRVRLDKLMFKDAEQLNGRFVVAQVAVTMLSYTWGNGQNLVTVIGTKGPGRTERNGTPTRANNSRHGAVGSAVACAVSRSVRPLQGAF